MLSVKKEAFDRLDFYWSNYRDRLRWNCIFTFPAFIRPWSLVFNSGSLPSIYSVWQGDEPIGIAPIIIKNEKATFIGDPEVFDFMDFMISPGKSQDFASILLECLKTEGVQYLELNSVRADSLVFTEMMPATEQLGYSTATENAEVSYEIELPSQWETYLDRVTIKKQKEFRRQFRRLNEAGNITHRIVSDAGEIEHWCNNFLNLHVASRQDKAEFMTEQMASYFRLLMKEMAAIGKIKLCFLEIEQTPIASTLNFEHDATVYLYNTGYDPHYKSLSVGFISQMAIVKNSIENQAIKYSFLKGEEAYKERMGGKKHQLHNCIVYL
ncbi:GNAT family N-acetyltransferase [Roseofilum sp. BLCC_M154]|uniref:GNAT family N-acetyltransferase n=1 Tax=Roseofilum acuticapitatum BLCC-M154 TaxID=3022444 RepID=A0ABT7ASI8_9CYAN|nr:GNAT family N-acetyltransferase [Roseofilum acuticapitatum]MDJ1169384.1 GNAT family N-acetyltransferase [Roseofilum acuticapitatum BLCC-M154]